MSACKSACDCYPYSDPETGGEVHESYCHSQVECDEGRWCDRHFEERANEHRWMRGLPKSAITGVLSEEDKQDIIDAGRGHLVRP